MSVSHSHETGAHGHELGFLRKYIFSEDHKIIGIQFLFSGIIFLFIGGALALLVRLQLGWPSRRADPQPLVPQELGRQDVARVLQHALQHARLGDDLLRHHPAADRRVRQLPDPADDRRQGHGVSQAEHDVVLVHVARRSSSSSSSFFVDGGGAGSGWTSYPTLASRHARPGRAGTRPRSPHSGHGQIFWLVALIFVGISSMMGSINYITTIINLRAPGMTLFRMPMTVWAHVHHRHPPGVRPAGADRGPDPATARQDHQHQLLPAAGRPDVRQLHTGAGGGQPLLWQHLFWFYSHPAVYIMILPAMGMVSDIIATFSRKPLFGYRPMVFAIAGIAGLGFIVWGHHMFQSGMDPRLGTGFMLATIMIALPSAVKVFNWLGTIWGGNIQYTTPMLNALAFVAMFIIGGLTGIFMAATPVDIYIPRHLFHRRPTSTTCCS